MLNGIEEHSGFLTHIYPDNRKNRLYLLGRLADGRSFAAVEDIWRPYFHIFKNDYSKAAALLKLFKYEEIKALDSFAGGELICLKFFDYNERSRAAAVLEESKIKTPDADVKPADLFLIEKQIKGYLRISAAAQTGKRVDVVFRNADISPSETGVSVPIRIASVDIETDVTNGAIRSIGIAWAETENNNITINDIKRRAGILSPAGLSSALCSSSLITVHTDEKSLLKSFLEDIRVIDPDILTGWNFLDFDFPSLSRRFEQYNLSFTIGRSKDSAKFFKADESGGWRRRSSAAIIPGRQALDALRVMRAGTAGASVTRNGQGFTLDEVAHNVLGEGKLIHETGDEKIRALDKLYYSDPARFAEYCLNDALLVLRILAKTGLYRLTMERACLTGVSLDKAWTSVVSFERVYAARLRKQGIALPAPNTPDVTGAAGGTVLECEAGLFENVAVFDFRSLYPTIIRTFNIDPLSHARAKKAGQTASESGAGNIVAPNGAKFSRIQGPLPALIAEYFATRNIAIENGDKTAAQVYKILMNSFYGVLGASACRYGKSALAGAITSFARKWLLFSRDWFCSKGYDVLYGDTDSLFIKTSFGDISYNDFYNKCADLAREFNLFLSRRIKKEYDLNSFIELRFDKAFRRFLIPPVRNFHVNGENQENQNESRGRAKGYGGYILNSDESCTLEVTGMEAIRSDSTPLARRLQLELLDLVFSGRGEDDFRDHVKKTVIDLKSGALDNELIYRKRLSRYPETYTSLTPPQVKAARALGWKKRKGVVEYIWTVNGPEPVSLPYGKIDYDHYVESQVFPLVRSIASAVQWNIEDYVTRKGGAKIDKQMELKF
ncbi:MAG: DNA polymerase II [Treponema sp.]|nr:DNA polymerase II [Treponema sp.]